MTVIKQVDKSTGITVNAITRTNNSKYYWFLTPYAKGEVLEAWIQFRSVYGIAAPICYVKASFLAAPLSWVPSSIFQMSSFHITELVSWKLSFKLELSWQNSTTCLNEFRESINYMSPPFETSVKVVDGFACFRIPFNKWINLKLNICRAPVPSECFRFEIH